MRRRLSMIAGSAILLVGVPTACGDDGGLATGGPGSGPAFGEPPHGTLVEGDGWRGVLLRGGPEVDRIQLPGGERHDATPFVPTEDDARRFEARLQESWDERQPQGETVDSEDYVRQYYGVEGAGARHLGVIGMCRADEGWDESIHIVDDGGSCYWYATMDLETEEIVVFSFHGDA